MGVSSVFCSALGQPFKIPSKKISLIPLYNYFDNLLQFLTIKKHHRNKCAHITPNKNPTLTIFNYKKKAS